MKYDKSANRESDLVKVVKAILFGSAVGAIVCACLLALFAFMFVSVKSVPQAMIQWLVIICAAIGAFTAGYISIRIYRSKGLIYGAMAGLLMFVILTVVAFIISRDKFTYITVIRLIAMVLSGAFGGVLGVNKKRRK